MSEPLSPPKLQNLSLADNGRHPANGAAANGDEDELARFRREWKQEVKAKQAGGGLPAAATAGAPAPTVPPSVPMGPVRWRGKINDTDSARSPPASSAPLPTSPRKARSSVPIKSPILGPTSPKVTVLTKPAAGVTSPTKPHQHLPPVASGERYGTPGASSSTWGKIPFRAPQVRKDRDGAITVYTEAVEAEQSGRLNDALHLYRRAFKMDDNVDRLYARRVRAETAAAAEAAEEAAVDEATSADVVDPAAPVDAPYEFTRHIQVHPDYERRELDGHGTEERLLAPVSRLTALFDSVPAATQSTFAPEDEALPIPIARLPAELVDPILAHLDVTSIESLGVTCWHARALTAQASVWRRLVERIYRPPMVPPQVGARELARRHRGEWRTALVEEERVRMDGCYISVCHYIRPGAGEAWIAVTHMITYHRFLRFYPDGLVISFLTTDHPSDVVPALNPEMRGKGLHFGRWKLIRSDASDSEDDDDSDEKAEPRWKGKGKKRGARVLITDLLEPGSDDCKYEFEMDLTLRETNRGRWNKLDLHTYSSVNLATGEVLGLSLKHQKPFYFSKVRSYHPRF